MRVRSPLPHKKARIEIIPLIDIMFFLLASFMMVSLSQTHMKGLRVNLPQRTNAPPPPNMQEYMKVRVTEGGLTYMNNELVDDGEVLPRLFALARQNKDAKVSISAEQLALHGDVIRLLDRVRLAGITKIGYQIKPAAKAP